MKASTKAIRFLETLTIPEGPKAGEKLKLKHADIVSNGQETM